MIYLTIMIILGALMVVVVGVVWWVGWGDDVIEPYEKEEEVFTPKARRGIRNMARRRRNR